MSILIIAEAFITPTKVDVPHLAFLAAWGDEAPTEGVVQDLQSSTNRMPIFTGCCLKTHLQEGDW